MRRFPGPDQFCRDEVINRSRIATIFEFCQLLETQRDNSKNHVSFSWARDSTEYCTDISKQDLADLLLDLCSAAAKLGNTDAQRKLAEFYRTGNGIETSKRAARFWQGLALRLDTQACGGVCQ